MSQSTLPRTWKCAKLEEALLFCDSGIWGGEPDGQNDYAVLQSNNIQDGLFHFDSGVAISSIPQSKVNYYRLLRGDIVVVKSSGSRDHIGKCALFDRVDEGFFLFSNFTLRLRVHPGRALADYLYFYLGSGQARYELEKIHATSSGLRNLQIPAYREQRIPLPPLPIQERIAGILQKADGVRRKRQEALGLADAILSSAFIAMFGDPRENSRGFKVTPLGELADVRSGVTKGRKLGGRETIEVPYLRVANVQDGYLDLSEVRTIEVLPQDIERYRLEDGDILMIEGCGNPNYLGRGSIWQDQIPGCIHQNHIFRVRTNRARLLPEFLAALLRTKYANGYFLACAKNPSGLSNTNSTQVKAFPVPEPPLVLQQKFVAALEQWEQINKRLTNGLAESKRLFRGLLQRAFTGELTAAWEAAHADEIAAEQTKRERLPRLVLLAFVRERQQCRPSEPVLITSLMKYIFLLQKEGTTGQALYHFIPYKYGPFARELYHDLEALAAEGLISVTESDEVRTEIALDPSQETTVQEMIAQLPERLRADVIRVLEQYGSLSHNQLVATVYEKYPAYATKSRLRRRSSWAD